MTLFIVARIFNRKKQVGFRILDADTEEVKLVSTEQVRQVLSRGIEIKNLTLKNSTIKGKGGALERYSAISLSGELISKSALVVISRNKDWYKLADYRGFVKSISKENLGLIAYSNNIANGKFMRDSANNFYISAIEGEYDTSMENQNQNQLDLGMRSLNKKYKLPTLNERIKLPKDDYRYVTFARLKSHFLAVKNPAVTEALLNRPSIERDSTAIKGDFGVAHEILCGYINDYNIIHDIGITGVRYSDNIQYLISVNWNKDYLVNDIIYIGKGFAQIGLGEAITTREDRVCAAVGQIGLVVITLNNVHTVKVIPYFKIDTYEKLSEQLLALGLNNLDKDSIDIILREAKNSIYVLSPCTNVEELPPMSFMIKPEGSEMLFPEEGVLECARTPVQNIYYKEPALDVDEYIKHYLHHELRLAFLEKEIFYFSHTPGIITSMKDQAEFKKAKDGVYLRYNNMRLKYLGMYILYTQGIIKEIYEEWISSEEAEYIDKTVFKTIVDGDTLQVFIETLNIMYSISKLTELCDKEKADLQGISQSVSRFNSKSALLGDEVKIDNRGYIVDWEAGEYIEQRDFIRGIELNTDNLNKKVTVLVKGKFEISNRATRRFYGTLPLRLVYKASNYDNLIHDVPDYLKIKVVSLDGATAEDLDKLIGFAFRQFIRNKVYIDGVTESVTLEKDKYTAKVIMKNCKLFFGGGTNIYVNLPLHVVDADKAPEEEKLNFIRELLEVIPTRRNVTGRDCFKIMFKNIVNCIFDRYKAEQILDKFYEWESN